jgi:hypothetical protein
MHKPKSVPQWPGSQTGMGYCKPFLLKKTPAKGLRGDSMGGSNSVMAKYHMNNCSNKGMLRVTST